MGDDARLTPRQIWANPTTTTSKSYSPGCTPFLLPSDGTSSLLLNRVVQLLVFWCRCVTVAAFHPSQL